MSEELKIPNREELADTINCLQDDNGYCNPLVLADCIITKYTRHESKPLTIPQIGSLFLTAKPELRFEDGKYELDVRATVEAIHAALPPDQSARIAELEADRDRWMEANGANTVTMHHMSMQLDQLKAAYKAMREALVDIKRTAQLHKNNVSMPGVSASAIFDQIKTILTQSPEEK